MREGGGGHRHEGCWDSRNDAELEDSCRNFETALMKSRAHEARSRTSNGPALQKARASRHPEWRAAGHAELFAYLCSRGFRSVGVPRMCRFLCSFSRSRTMPHMRSQSQDLAYREVVAACKRDGVTVSVWFRGW